jgi:hypothetical protein
MKEQTTAAILQVLIFGVTSLCVLALTWFRPMSGIDRVLSTIIGATGMLVCLVKARHLRMGTKHST